MDDYYLEMLQYCDRNTLTDGSDVIDYAAAWCYDDFKGQSGQIRSPESGTIG